MKVSVLGVFWSVFSSFRTENGDLRNNTDQENSYYGHFPRSVSNMIISVMEKKISMENFTIVSFRRLDSSYSLAVRLLQTLQGFFPQSWS